MADGGWISVGSIATHYDLDSLGIESQMGEKFSMLVQVGSKAHLPSCTVVVGSFLVVQWPGHGADCPPPSSAMVMNSLELYFCLPSVPS